MAIIKVSFLEYLSNLNKQELNSLRNLYRKTKQKNENFEYSLFWRLSEYTLGKRVFCSKPFLIVNENTVRKELNAPKIGFLPKDIKKFWKKNKDTFNRLKEAGYLEYFSLSLCDVVDEMITSILHNYENIGNVKDIIKRLQELNLSAIDWKNPVYLEDQLLGENVVERFSFSDKEKQSYFTPDKKNYAFNLDNPSFVLTFHQLNNHIHTKEQFDNWAKSKKCDTNLYAFINSFDFNSSSVPTMKELIDTLLNHNLPFKQRCKQVDLMDSINERDKKISIIKAQVENLRKLLNEQTADIVLDDDGIAKFMKFIEQDKNISNYLGFVEQANQEFREIISKKESIPLEYLETNGNLVRKQKI